MTVELRTSAATVELVREDWHAAARNLEQERFPRAP